MIIDWLPYRKPQNLCCTVPNVSQMSIAKGLMGLRKRRESTTERTAAPSSANARNPTMWDFSSSWFFWTAYPGGNSIIISAFSVPPFVCTRC